jgi:hypothetical protein
METNPYSYHPAASAAAPRALRDPAMVGRAAGLISALLGLGLVAAFFGSAGPAQLLRNGAALIPGLVGLGLAVWWIGGRAGRAVARRRGWHVLWLGPTSGVLALLGGALSLGLASFLVYGLGDMHWGLTSALWDYLGKPVLAITGSGAIPAALLGLVSGAVTWGLTRRGQGSVAG